MKKLHLIYILFLIATTATQAQWQRTNLLTARNIHHIETSLLKSDTILNMNSILPSADLESLNQSIGFHRNIKNIDSKLWLSADISGLSKRDGFSPYASLGLHSDFVYHINNHKFNLHIGSYLYSGKVIYFNQSVLSDRQSIPSYHSIVVNDYNMGIHPQIHFRYTSPYYMYAEVGMDSHHIGNGIRSLLLSDNAPAYPYVKVGAEFGKIRYAFQYNIMELDTLNIVRYLPPANSIGLVSTSKMKYSAIHYLDWQIGKRFNLGLFETVVWKQSDGRPPIEWNYVNPIVFFRPVEFSMGSSDNALMGLNLSYRFGKSFIVYSQIVLDDIIVGQFINDTKYAFGILPEGEEHGWFANKYGAQLGFKYHNVLGVERSIIQSEVSAVRPGTYGHINPRQSYTHNYHELAHPLGANFIESYTRLLYGIGKWNFGADVVYALRGISSATYNAGENVFYPLGDGASSFYVPIHTYGNHILQGERQQLIWINVDVCRGISNKYPLEVFASFSGYKEHSNTTSYSDIGIRVGLRLGSLKY